MYILLVFKRELSKNDYLRPLLITIIKSIKKLKKNYLKIIQTDKKKVITQILACALSDVMSM